MNINGIHHITAIASDPATNVAFYTQVLGLRLVKKTVNFDDPQTYHLYYGDEVGTPGTVLTFFPWANARRGTPGVGQVLSWAFRVPSGSLEYWKQRLSARKVADLSSFVRFGRKGLSFRDHDNFLIDIVESDEATESRVWMKTDVPREYAIQGFYGATLGVAAHGPTGKLLERLGAELGKTEGAAQRYTIGRGPARSRLDLQAIPGSARGQGGAGTIHHIAFRTPSDEAQAECLRELRKEGFAVSPVQDRSYFHSIYFTEPGGVLFEVATDSPGFTVDETLEALGTQLRVPVWLEPHKKELERVLPPLGQISA